MNRASLMSLREAKRRGSPRMLWMLMSQVHVDRFVALLLAMTFLGGASADQPQVDDLLYQYCYDCHDTDTQKGDFDLEKLGSSFNGTTAAHWEDVVRQLTIEEMPPYDKKQPSSAERSAMIHWLSQKLLAYHNANPSESGTVLRRLNRIEYTNTLRDLLYLNTDMWDPVDAFPDDESWHNLDKIGEELITSDNLIKNYLATAEDALDRATYFSGQPEVKVYFEKPGDDPDRYKLTHEQEAYRKHVSQDHIVLLNSPHMFGGYLPIGGMAKDGVPISGNYEIIFTAQYEAVEPHFKSIDHNYKEAPLISVVCTPPINNHRGRPDIRDVVLETFDLPMDGQPYTFKTTHRLEKGWVARVAWINGPVRPPVSTTLIKKELPELWKPVDKGKMTGPEKLKALKDYAGILMSNYRGPMVKISRAGVRGPHYHSWPPISHQRLLGEYQIDTAKPADVLTLFAYRAFRRMVSEEEIAPMIRLVEEHLKKPYSGKDPFAHNAEAYKSGFRAVLASPYFMYLDENEGVLSDFALANRLSYFLWSSMPDSKLFNAAMQGKLRDGEVFWNQVKRMLNDEKASAFKTHFVDRWLELYKLGTMPPDAAKYPDYFRYHYEKHMRTETEMFFAHILEKNLPIRNFIHSDFTFMNGPLARIYGVDGVDGVRFQKVPVRDPRRGGLLGQASILTASANGVDTSPIVRGIWVLDNLLGLPPKPPPDGTPAIEPDIRGTTTIREQMDKHRTVESCNKCHKKIDPYGFALENFDPIGMWREEYPSGHEIVTHGETPKGEPFNDIVELKKSILKQERQVARCITEKMLSYATGRKLNFKDRVAVEGILDANAPKGYHMGDLLAAVILSERFRVK